MKHVRHIYYICPDLQNPTGGIKAIYQHVDILNKHGISAYVLHSTPGFRCTWFENQTPIAYYQTSLPSRFKDVKSQVKKKLSEWLLNAHPANPPAELDWTTGFKTQLKKGREQTLPPISSQDIVVLPEYFAFQLYSNMPEQPFVIFNQGAYCTFINSQQPKPFQPEITEKNPYKSQNLLGVFAVSSNNVQYLKFAFPSITICRIPNSIDADMFSYQRDKQKQIAFVIKEDWRRDIVQVLKILQTRQNLKDWTYALISRKTQSETAGILKKSAIYLSFAYQEGFSLPPAEAIACGCIVIGYQGQGGDEYLKEPLAYPIASGDVLSFVKKVEEVALNYVQNNNFYLDKTQKASQFILQEYSVKHVEEKVLEAWNRLLKA